jgi:hypothetical protein
MVRVCAHEPNLGWMKPSWKLANALSGEREHAFAMAGACVREATRSSVFGLLGADTPAEIRIYQQGGHGFGTRPRHQPVDTWIERFGDWLRSLKLAN